MTEETTNIKQSEPVLLSGLVTAVLLNLASVVMIFIAVDETSKQLVMAMVQSLANLIGFGIMMFWTRKNVVSPKSFKRVVGRSVRQAFPRRG